MPPHTLQAEKLEKYTASLSKFIRFAQGEGGKREMLLAMLELLQQNLSRSAVEGENIPGAAGLEMIFRGLFHAVYEPEPNAHYVEEKFELAAKLLLDYRLPQLKVA